MRFSSSNDGDPAAIALPIDECEVAEPLVESGRALKRGFCKAGFRPGEFHATFSRIGLPFFCVRAVILVPIYRPGEGSDQRVSVRSRSHAPDRIIR